MATMINGQLILEEEYDENYQPTEQGKWNFNFAVFVMFTSKFIQGFSDWNKARNIFLICWTRWRSHWDIGGSTFIINFNPLVWRSKMPDSKWNVGRQPCRRTNALWCRKRWSVIRVLWFDAVKKEKKKIN